MKVTKKDDVCIVTDCTPYNKILFQSKDDSEAIQWVIDHSLDVELEGTFYPNNLRLRPHQILRGKKKAV